MSRLLDWMAHEQLVDEWSSRAMIAILTGQRHNGLLPEPLPAGTQIAHKTGTLHDTLNNVGIVYLNNSPYVIAVLTTHLPTLAARRNSSAAFPGGSTRRSRNSRCGVKPTRCRVWPIRGRRLPIVPPTSKCGHRRQPKPAAPNNRFAYARTVREAYVLMSQPAYFGNSPRVIAL